MHTRKWTAYRFLISLLLVSLSACTFQMEVLTPQPSASAGLQTSLPPFDPNFTPAFPVTPTSFSEPLTAIPTPLSINPTPVITLPEVLPLDVAPTDAQASTDSFSVWKTYQNEMYGFSFEYPAIYEEMPYKDSCGLKESSDGIHVGLGSELLFLDSGGLELAEYTNNLLQGKDWSVDSRESQLIDGLEAITVQYRFGGTNRFGTFTLVKDGERIFAFSLSPSNLCGIPDSPRLSELNAYAHMLETFRLDK
jgi:hypothetical protein